MGVVPNFLKVTEKMSFLFLILNFPVLCATLLRYDTIFWVVNVFDWFFGFFAASSNQTSASLGGLFFAEGFSFRSGTVQRSEFEA